MSGVSDLHEPQKGHDLSVSEAPASPRPRGIGPPVSLRPRALAPVSQSIIQPCGSSRSLQNSSDITFADMAGCSDSWKWSQQTQSLCSHKLLLFCLEGLDGQISRNGSFAESGATWLEALEAKPNHFGRNWVLFSVAWLPEAWVFTVYMRTSVTTLKYHKHKSSTLHLKVN